MEEKQGLDSIKHFVKKNNLHKLGFNPLEYATNVVEELLELLTDMESKEAREFAKATVDRWVKVYNIDVKKIQEHKAIDSIGDIIVFSTDAIMKNEYCVDCVLTEIGKEINSRKQDPEQAKRWAEEGPQQGEKWQKDLNQSQEEKYQADFTNCKLSSFLNEKEKVAEDYNSDSWLIERFNKVK